MYRKMNLRLFEDGNAGEPALLDRAMVPGMETAAIREMPGQHTVMNRRKRSQTQGQAKRNVRHLPIISEARA